MATAEAKQIKTAVFGASGYIGAELLRLLDAHPNLGVVYASAQSNAGALVSELFPSLAMAYPELRCTELDVATLPELDLVFTALPHGHSQRFMGELLKRVEHVVDLGADFRLPQDTYAHWYREEHQAPALLGEFAFGLPELFRERIKEHAHVASPGCYPTAAALALAPLMAAGLIEPQGIVVDALSGVSGRGRGLSLASLYGEANENASAYGLLDHRHTAEMEMALGAVGPAPAPAQVLFTPHLVPMTRGILATCYARPAPGVEISTDGLLDVARSHYEGEPFVMVLDEPPSTKATYGSNAAHLTYRYDPRTGFVLAIAAIDNIVKGAAGQAIQNANLLLGLDEAAGLHTTGLMP